MNFAHDNCDGVTVVLMFKEKDISFRFTFLVESADCVRTRFWFWIITPLGVTCFILWLTRFSCQELSADHLFTLSSVHKFVSQWMLVASSGGDLPVIPLQSNPAISNHTLHLTFSSLLGVKLWFENDLWVRMVQTVNRRPRAKRTRSNWSNANFKVDESRLFTDVAKPWHVTNRHSRVNVTDMKFAFWNTFLDKKHELYKLSSRSDPNWYSREVWHVKRATGRANQILTWNNKWPETENCNYFRRVTDWSLTILCQSATEDVTHKWLSPVTTPRNHDHRLNVASQVIINYPSGDKTNVLPCMVFRYISAKRYPGTRARNNDPVYCWTRGMCTRLLMGNVSSHFSGRTEAKLNCGQRRALLVVSKCCWYVRGNRNSMSCTNSCPWKKCNWKWLIFTRATGEIDTGAHACHLQQRVFNWDLLSPAQIE